MKKADNRTESKAVAGFGDRLKTAATARKAQLEKWRLNLVDVNDPAFQERQAALRAAADAEAAAQAKRDEQRLAEKIAAREKAIADRKAAQQAIEDQSIAEQAAREAAKAEEAAALIALSEQRKAARDARYAARKARK